MHQLLLLNIPDEHLSVSRNPARKEAVSPGKKLSYYIVQEKSPHKYMNIDLSEGISGLNELVKPGYVRINPSDAMEMRLKDGDTVNVSDSKIKKSYPVVVRKDIPRGLFCLTVTNGYYDFEKNPCYVNIKKAHV